KQAEASVASAAADYELLSNESFIEDSSLAVYQSSLRTGTAHFYHWQHCYSAASARLQRKKSSAVTSLAINSNSVKADKLASIERQSLSSAWVPVSAGNGQLRESPTAAAVATTSSITNGSSNGNAFVAVTSSSSLNQLRDPLQEPKSAAEPDASADPYFLLPFFSTAQQQQFPVTMATSSVANSGDVANVKKSPAANGGRGGGSSGSACGSLSSLTGARKIDLCAFCGQFHEPGATHLYDYNQQVDQDLLCKLCQQPLVEPLDTKCGHTFCTPCLKSHLAKQALCPIDKSIINFMECSQASSLVKKLLDKLLVVCPNVDYCEEVLQRANLEAHLTHRCRGAVTRCPKASAGCSFQGPKTALQNHLLECQFRSDDELPPAEPDYNADWPPKEPIISGLVSTIEIQRGCLDLGVSFVGGCDTPLSCIVIQEIYIDGLVAKDGRLRPGDQILEVNGVDLTQATHCQAKRALSQLTPFCRLSVYRELGAVPSDQDEDNDDEACWAQQQQQQQLQLRQLHQQRQEQQEHQTVLLTVSLFKRAGKRLGIKLVGKKTCPGLFILGLVPGGLAEMDGRLRRDDRILEINGFDIGDGTQAQAASIIQSAKKEVAFLVARRVVSGSTPPMQPINAMSAYVVNSSNSGLDDEEAAAGKDAEAAAATATDNDEEEDEVAAYAESAPSKEPPKAKAEVDEIGVATDKEDAGKEDDGEAEEAGRDTPEGESEELIREAREEEEEAEQQDQVDSNDGDDNGGHVAEEDAGDDSPPPTPPPHQQQQQQLHHLEHHPAPYLFAAETLVDRCVVLEKSPGESLGMSVAGGVGSQRGDIPVYVTNLPPEGLAARSRQIRKGDIVLGVNEASLLGLQHEEAVSVLKSQPAGQVRIQLLQGPESSSGGGNFMPSWVYWLALPPFCYLEKAVRLCRDPRTGSLGFSIVGGCDSANGPQPIIVKSIVHGGPAHAHGQLRCGDLIIRVNGAYGLSGVTHSEAVSLLKQLPSEIIVLSVVSWPGTIV
ncbi:hypothetical protein BOX15_Mlig014573g1, partial [Macrostomum lignano]